MARALKISPDAGVAKVRELVDITVQKRHDAMVAWAAREVTDAQLRHIQALRAGEAENAEFYRGVASALNYVMGRLPEFGL
jgi:hypothetical protein